MKVTAVREFVTRRPRTVHVVRVGDEYRPIEIARASTPAEARAQAEARVTHTFAAYADPRIIVGGDHMALIWFDVRMGEWTYRLGPENRGGLTYANWQSVDEAERAARHHIAQIASDPDIAHPDDRDEVTRYLAWQDAYAMLRGQGLDDGDAHELAGRFQAEMLAA